MIQLILHGIGDYFLQTDEQALNKKKKGFYGFCACLAHCLSYSIPFFFIGTWKAVLVIFITHFIIDRTNIVAYALAFKNGIRKPGFRNYDISNFGFGLNRPFAITIWLYIITDNICHIICNYLALKYL